MSIPAPQALSSITVFIHLLSVFNLLTLSGDIHLVPTPGHSSGHLSVILVKGDLSIVFAGDASYSEVLLIAQKTDGLGVDPQAQHNTHLKILAYVEQ